ncbi:MAG: ABC transporter substrate-binding protein [Chloroflexota bacterium]|nr:ABC transporter substrate-binding protein [Chloroflexota bacterium]
MPRRLVCPWARSLLLLLFLLPLLVAAPTAVRSQANGTPGLSCEPASPRSPASPVVRPSSSPAALAGAPADRVEMRVGFIPISIYAPVFVAQEKGYFASQGLDVTLEPLAGGNDLVVLTANGELQAAATGAGPGLWNAVARGLPISVVAPGHREGSPVATPLMISREACESGAIRSVADLRGKRVAVNARGATEYWLAQALATGGLSLNDIQLQTLAFQDAVAALAAGALDASMVGEPLATRAEQQGIAVRLAIDFPVQDVLPTAIVVNSDFAEDNPAAVQGFVTAYMQASRDLSDGGFADPGNLAIVERYTNVRADLVAAAVPPIYFPNGEIDAAALGALQSFFRERDQLQYDEDIDPNTFVDRRFVEAALAALGPYPAP